MKYEQQIDRFLFGQMGPEEESLFLQECKTNKELKDEAVMMALLVKTIKQTHNMEKNYHVITNFKVHKFEWYSEALQFALNNEGSKLYIKEFSAKYEN